jgi:dGTPase
VGALNFYRPGDHKRMVDIPDSGSPEDYRTPFRRDYARIIHTPAFRRLQRKTQLFPGDESDFFRNRMTHSLEVAQIAKSIAIRLNYLVREAHGDEADTIDTDLVELVSLAHDMGHPPFGHTGEYALQGRMYPFGGFEGNAQTLRILSRLEKRQTIKSGDSADFTEFDDGNDLRVGLNLCFRSLAGVLKYDNSIPVISADPKLIKGYYESENEIIEKVKRAVLGEQYGDFITKPFRVIEMQIMDLADDIAYSTYDFEDALKAGFASPLDIIQQVNSNAEIRDAVASKIFQSENGREYPKGNPATQDRENFERIQNRMTLFIFKLLKAYLSEADKSLTEEDRSALAASNEESRTVPISVLAVHLQKLSEQIAQNGYIRAQFTSDLVGKRIRAVGIDINEDLPALSTVTIDPEIRFEIDVLKHLTFELHIKSPRLKLIEYRGNQIVQELFDCFENAKDGDLFPNDWRARLRAFRSFNDREQMRKRLISDYISGMTDAYALDVYSRLKTTNPAALFRPT